MQQKFSVVVITHNEEKNIARCLSSVKNSTDDIVVVDSFSTDSTQQIAEQFGVRFIQQAWQGYAKTKNKANEHARYDWVLSLDADEALSLALKTEIDNLIIQDNRAYSFNRLNNYCGQWIRFCAWYPDKKIRLFNKHDAKWNGGVHETLQFANAHTKTIHLKGNILHYSYYTVPEHKNRTSQYAQIAAQEKFQKGVKATFIKRFLSPLFTFIKTYFLRLGFLDGRNGFRICTITAQGVYSKYALLHQLWQKK